MEAARHTELEGNTKLDVDQDQEALDVLRTGDVDDAERADERRQIEAKIQEP